jgi:hypothetical protein
MISIVPSKIIVLGLQMRMEKKYPTSKNTSKRNRKKRRRTRRKIRRRRVRKRMVKWEDSGREGRGNGEIRRNEKRN